MNDDESRTSNIVTKPFTDSGTSVVDRLEKLLEESHRRDGYKSGYSVRESMEVDGELKRVAVHALPRLLDLYRAAKVVQLGFEELDDRPREFASKLAHVEALDKVMFALEEKEPTP